MKFYVLDFIYFDFNLEYEYVINIFNTWRKFE